MVGQICWALVTVMCMLGRICAVKRYGYRASPPLHVPQSVSYSQGRIRVTARHSTCFQQASITCRISKSCDGTTEWVQAWNFNDSLHKCCSSKNIKLSQKRWTNLLALNGSIEFVSKSWSMGLPGVVHDIITHIGIVDSYAYVTSSRAHCFVGKHMHKKRCLKCDMDPCTAYDWGYTVSLADAETNTKQDGKDTRDAVCGRTVKLDQHNQD